MRELSRKLATSPATVFAAYGELEQRGLIEARPQSGFYVRRGRELPPEPAMTAVRAASAAVTTSEITRELIDVGRRPNVLALDVAAPSPELVPNVAYARALAGAVRRRSMIAALYCNPPGHLPLRKVIAQRALDWGGSIAPDDVVITNGATEAIHLCLRAVAKPGDLIAVESPTYYGALQAIEGLRMRALELPTSPQTGLSLPHLQRALSRQRVAAVFAMPNFANPLGTRMPDDAKRELVQMLARADVPLIEDDVAGDLAFDGSRPRTAKSYDERGLVLLCSSVSKAISPGARIGWAMPGRYRDQVIYDQWTTTCGANPGAQLAITDFMTSGGYDRHLRRFRAVVERTVLRMSDAIARNFGPGTALTRPSGGLVLWISLPGRCDALDLQRVALAEGIAIMPGVLFSPRPIYREHIRLSCAMPYTPTIERAIATLGKLSQS